MQTTLNPPTPGRMNGKLIMPFAAATINVFTKMMKIKPVVAAPRLKTDSGATYDVSGIIGFSGDIVGSVVVSFQMQTAKKLVEALTGAEIDPTSPDFVDAIGELTNMIAGNAKKDLEVVANISIPTIIIGHNHTIGRLTGVPCVVIPCRTEAGDFAVEVNIQPIR